MLGLMHVGERSTATSSTEGKIFRGGEPAKRQSLEYHTPACLLRKKTDSYTASGVTPGGRVSKKKGWFRRPEFQKTLFRGGPLKANPKKKKQKTTPPPTNHKNSIGKGKSLQMMSLFQKRVGKGQCPGKGSHGGRG